MPLTQKSVLPGEIFKRCSISLFLFGVVLTGGLMLSWQFLLPEMTRIEVAGKERDLAELQAYQSNLVSEIDTAQAKRTQLILPIQNEQYLQLKEQKMQQFTVLQFKEFLRRMTGELQNDQQTVFYTRVAYSATEHAVSLEGTVRNVGPRSMTVLAQFVELLRSNDAIASVEGAKYLREEHPDVGMYSPFSLRLILQ